MQPDKILNTGEMMCGELIMLVAQHMKSLTAGQLLEVVTHDLGAAEEIPAWCRMTSHSLIEVRPNDSTTSFFIRKELK